MTEKKKFEIINPSDEAYIEGSFKVCCLATLIFGEGQYALQQVDGNLKMPLFIFGIGFQEWLKKTFGKEFTGLLDETNIKDIKKALLSIHLVRERTSLNDFTSYAHKLGRTLKRNDVIK